MTTVPHPHPPPRLWRQGDVLIQECATLPGGCTRRKSAVIAKGEATGHSHRLSRSRGSVLYDPPPAEARDAQFPGLMYLTVPADGNCTVAHSEHAAVVLPPGCYRLWRQREFDGEFQTWRVAGD